MSDIANAPAPPADAPAAAPANEVAINPRHVRVFRHLPGREYRSLVSSATEVRSGWLRAGNRNLRSHLLNFLAEVAAGDRAIVDQLIRFLSHVSEACWPPEFAPELHFHAVVRTDWDGRVDHRPAKDKVQDPCNHFKLRVAMVGIQIDSIHV